MFDIGGWEFLIVVVVAIIVIGPKDLPVAIRTVTGWVRRARELAREFQSGLDDLARETEMDTIRNDIESGLGIDEIRNTGNSIRDQVEKTVDPNGDIENVMKEDNFSAEDDGPFADNTFEEDEDVDGAGSEETEEDVKQAVPAERPSVAITEVGHGETPDKREDVATQAVEKPRS